MTITAIRMCGLDRLKLLDEMFEVGPPNPFLLSIGTEAGVPSNR